MILKSAEDMTLKLAEDMILESAEAKTARALATTKTGRFKGRQYQLPNCN
jgi:Mor family transcriptional regulator